MAKKIYRVYTPERFSFYMYVYVYVLRDITTGIMVILLLTGTNRP